MEPEFWNSWQLWEKLCFILACGIVLTILAGCIKLFYMRYELRSHTAIAASKKDEEQMQQTTDPRSESAPFGIRAIESGIEVDDVWISRSNTPVSSTRPSPASSMDEIHCPPEGQKHYDHHEKAVPTLAMPQPLYPHADSSRSKSRLPEGSPDMQNLEAIFEVKQLKQAPLPAATVKIQVRPTYQPRHSSHLRFSSMDTTEGTSVLNPMDSQHMSQTASSYADTDTYSLSTEEAKNQFSSRSSLDSANDMRHYAPRPLGHMHTSSSVYSSSINQSAYDLAAFTRRSIGGTNTLTTHQQSNPSESGRLIPRIRISDGTSIDWTDVDDISEDMHSSVNEYLNRRPTSLEDPPSKPNKSTTVKVDYTDASVFQNFKDSDPTNTKRQSEPLLYATGEVETRIVIKPLQTAYRIPQFREPKLPVVARKVNSGFEILPPGTFDTSSSDNLSIPTSQTLTKKQHRKIRSETIFGRSRHLFDGV